jgi:hypothetical protein
VRPAGTRRETGTVSEGEERPSVSGHTDPEGEAPWAMQLVARIERVDPPSRSAVCEAVAVAVARLLADDRVAPGGEWAPPVDRWVAGRIRKHFRRARGVAWTRVQSLPGVTAAVSGAEARALVPGPTDAVPREVDKLQLSGRELEDPSVRRAVDPEPDGPVVVSVSPEPPLPLGKAAAAAGHAGQLVMSAMTPERLTVWAALGFAVVVEHPDPSRWRQLRAIAPVEVIDAGFTVVEPGTCTALGRWA